MAWPPPTLPTTRTDTTVMASTHPADHNAVNLAVNDIVTYVKGTPWVAATLTAPWVPYDGTTTLMYRKVNDIVYWRGLIKGGAIGQAIATLPVGFRPGSTAINTWATNGNGAYACINIAAATGQVALTVGAGSSFLYMDAVSYSTTA